MLRLKIIFLGHGGGAIAMDQVLSFEELMANMTELYNEELHYDLKGDLIKYLSKLKGNSMWR